MKHLKTFQPDALGKLLKIRTGETKLGENIANDWQHPAVKFVLLGVEEDIGVRVNGGIGGAHTAWQSFLAAFLNIQISHDLNGAELGIFGHFNFDDLKDVVRPETVEQIDREVCEAIELIARFGKTPIVIGGGHNNAYPIIKGIAIAKKQSVNTINLDAHADFRVCEGRHSGNGFRYAYMEGFLKKYAVIGLYRNYNVQAVIDEMAQNPDISFCFWEDIFLKEKISFKAAVRHAYKFTKGAPAGIEIDLDTLENTLASAMTPCGITVTQARQYVHTLAYSRPAAYLHICEGASQLADGQQSATTGKLISYLVSDFVIAGRVTKCD
jgi:formiminoglutamase